MRRFMARGMMRKKGSSMGPARGSGVRVWHAKPVRAWHALPLLALSLPPNFAPAADPPRPNVIVVMTDDQGYGDLSGHGNPVLKTPHLDRLHDESVRFADFHAAPMCTPTRGQFLTGRDALANGAMNVSSGRSLLRREIPTAAELFAAAGWRTGHFGKWHLGDNHPFRPEDRGFQETLWYPSSHLSSAPDAWSNDYFDDIYSHNGRRERFAGYTTDVLFAEAMRWMKAQAGAGQPFFCYLPTAAAHSPLFVPAEYRKPYAGQSDAVARFFGMIANLDENMGKLDAFLRETGLRENTIFVWLTDNGGTYGVKVFNAGMRGKKIELYEGGHRVPCFVRWPAGGLRAPGDIRGLVEVQDLLPTLLELCGITAPAASFDGANLAAVLRDPATAPPDRTLVIQFSRMNDPEPKKGDACVLWRRWRLVSDRELYELDSDPGQVANVIDAHPDVAARMRAYYDAWWARVSPRVNEFGRIVAGSDADNPCLLSPADWMDVFLDQQRQVRAGEAKNGAWNLQVDRDGEYVIVLRRWPEEADLPIRAGIPATTVTDGEFLAGKALPVATARLAVGEFDATRIVNSADKAAAFTVRLKAGPARLQTWFLDETGREICGAYYVTVRRR